MGPDHASLVPLQQSYKPVHPLPSLSLTGHTIPVWFVRPITLTSIGVYPFWVKQPQPTHSSLKAPILWGFMIKTPVWSDLSILDNCTGRKWGSICTSPCLNVQRQTYWATKVKYTTFLHYIFRGTNKFSSTLDTFMSLDPTRQIYHTRPSMQSLRRDI